MIKNKIKNKNVRRVSKKTTKKPYLKNKTPFLLKLIITSVVSIVLVILLVSSYIQKRTNSKLIKSTNINVITSTISEPKITGAWVLTSDIKTTPEPTIMPIPESVKKFITTGSKESVLINYDDEYNLYINGKFGFYLKIPKYFLSNKGICQKENNDSFINTSEKIPLIFLEDNNSVYIAPKYYYLLTNEEKISSDDGIGFIYKYHGCQKIITNISDLSTNYLKNPKGTAEFFQINFTDLVSKKPVSFSSGQDLLFTRPNGEGTYDEEIIRSLNFINK